MTEEATPETGGVHTRTEIRHPVTYDVSNTPAASAYARLLDPIDEFVREQLASGRFSDYEALVRYALASLKDRQSEIDEIAEELRPGIESMKRDEPGLILDFDEIKQPGRKRLMLDGNIE